MTKCIGCRPESVYSDKRGLVFFLYGMFVNMKSASCIDHFNLCFKTDTVLGSGETMLPTPMERTLTRPVPHKFSVPMNHLSISFKYTSDCGDLAGLEILHLKLGAPDAAGL